MNDDLVTFLNARLDEDEEIARDPMAETWTKSDAPSIFVMGNDELVAETSAFADARHIARHDPARVLAEVGAKRRILAAYTGWVDRNAGPGRSDDADAGQEYGLEEAVRYLTLPYAAHPDYRPEWAPEA